jgi:hypothetical protein
MSEPVKAALILGIAIIVAAGSWIYFSPYQTCLRANPYMEPLIDTSAPEGSDQEVEGKKSP